MNSLTVSGITNEFMEIEYSGADKIYVPIDKLSLVQSIPVAKKVSRLDKLKSQG